MGTRTDSKKNFGGKRVNRELFREQSLIADSPAILASNSQAAHFWKGKKAGHGCTRRKFFKHGAKSSKANHPLFP